MVTKHLNPSEAWPLTEEAKELLPAPVSAAKHTPGPLSRAAKRAVAWRVFICPEVMPDGTVGGHWSYSTVRISADYEPVTATQLVEMANAATRDPSDAQLQAAVLSAVGGAPPNYALAGWRAGRAAIAKAAGETA